METLRLVKPTLEFAEPYLAMEKEEVAADARLIGVVPTSLAELVRHIEVCEVQERLGDASTGGVPQTSFWLLRNNADVIGTCRLRHRLTPFGGHIDYGIRTSERRKGYGRRLIALLIEEAVKLSIDRLLLICRKDNTASIRVIEKNGGELESDFINPNTGKSMLRYWITVR